MAFEIYFMRKKKLYLLIFRFLFYRIHITDIHDLVKFLAIDNQIVTFIYL